jgi:transcriptional regulator with XRE-family HTH domain
MSEGIGQRIRKLRKALGLSQEEFGKKLGVTLRTIARYERGETIVPDRTLRQIEQTFSVNPEWLRHGRGEMFKPKPAALEELLQKLGIKDQEEIEILKDLLQAYVELPPEEKELYYHEIKARALRRKLEGKGGSKF